ncbi:MAG: hypothetical protein ACKVOK_01280 [Flavobacteriales bacterium]
MQILTTHIARILFALPFLIFGISHMIEAEVLSGMVPEELPGGSELYVYLTGAIELICAGSIILKKYDFYAGLILAALMILYALLIHLPAVSGSPVAVSNLLKDVALSGAALIYVGTTKK